MPTGATGKIKILAGVKQGYSFSPLLSNLILDDQLMNIVNSNIGIEVGGKHVESLAFADDLALIADNSGDMEVLFASKRQRANDKKCGSLQLLPGKARERRGRAKSGIWPPDIATS